MSHPRSTTTRSDRKDASPMTRPTAHSRPDHHTPPLPSVLIRTLPLLHGNYGGILQAFALQTFLREQGVQAVTDSAVEYRWSVRTPVGTALALARGRLDARLTPAMRNTVNRDLVAFVQDTMQTVDGLVASGIPRRSVLDGISVAISGSDQVWRHSYGDVRRFLFSDLPDPAVRKISYAASFGKDDLLEYPPGLLGETATLAQQFSALSVREDTGVGLCREHWSATAERHLDPVFLLEASRYRAIVGSRTDVVDRVEPGAGTLFAYVLDGSPAKTALLERIASRLGLRLHTLVVPAEGSRQGMRRDPGAHVRPAMEKWIGAIADADFVVTDSFHGAAMSILLNTPHIALINRQRGAARFESLHRAFGLEDRLVADMEDALPAAVTDPVDWGRVNEIIDSERQRSWRYLRSHLPEMAEPTAVPERRAGGGE